MHRVNWNETGDYVIAAVIGGALAGVVFKAFVLGAAGAIGGMAAKWIVGRVKKKFFTNKKELS